MKSSIGTVVLRFAAMAVLLVHAAAAQAQGSSQSVCQNVWDPVAFKRLRVCNEVYNPSPPQPPQSAPAAEPQVGRATSETVPYDPADETRKVQLRAADHRDRPSSGLCPAPYRMTASDGCQK
jgi:hypothetical protein